MLFPYRTNALVQHWPFGTVALITSSFAVAAVLSPQRGNLGAAAPWALVHGQGLHPLQWVTWSFVHVGLWQLLANMAFLWVFGLVVEGKLGWRRFLPMYLGLGVAQAALVQVSSVVLEVQGVSFGSTATLFGLAAMALLWAPENDVELLYFLGFIVGRTSWKVRSLALAFVLWELGTTILQASAGRASLASASLQLAGAALGFALGVLLLRRGLVDCEGWDLFSLRRRRPGQLAVSLASSSTGAPSPGRGRAPASLSSVATVTSVAEVAKATEPDDAELEDGSESPAERQARIAEERTTALTLLRGYVREGSPRMAAIVYEDSVRADGPWPLDAPVLQSLVESFLGQDDLAGARSFLEQHVERFPHGPPSMRLLLAHALVAGGGGPEGPPGDVDPARALELLEQLGDGAYLEEPQQRLRRKIEAEARRLLEGPWLD